MWLKTPQFPISSHPIEQIFYLTSIAIGYNSDGKGEWSEMVRIYVEEGWSACFEKSVVVRSEGQEEARMTKEDVEDASGEESKSVGLEKEDALNSARCWVGVGEIPVRVG